MLKKKNVEMSRSVKNSCAENLLSCLNENISEYTPILAAVLLYLQKSSRGSFGEMLFANRSNIEYFINDLSKRRFVSVSDGACWNEELCSKNGFGDATVGKFIKETVSSLGRIVSEQLANCIKTIDYHEISAEDIVYAFEHFSDTDKRQKDGSFYTNEKVARLMFDPLFLDEFRRVLATGSELEKSAVVEKIAKALFLDPACGCGSILLEVKRSLMSLFEAFGIERPPGLFALTVGFEFDEKAACCAELALRTLDKEFELPSRKEGYVVCGNATEINWSDYGTFDYIVGNPPFLGGTKLSATQKDDMRRCWGHLYKSEMDYVSCWFRLAAEYIRKHVETKVAYISTNSVTQGVQLSSIWPPLLGTVRLSFAYQSFRWDQTMLVNVVIIGLESRKSPGSPYNPVLYEVDDPNAAEKKFKRIALEVELAPHLQPNVPFVELTRRTTNISPNVPQIHIGAQIVDSLDTKGFTMELADVECAYEKSRTSLPFIRPFVSAKELLHGKEMYCLDLQNAAVVPKVFEERVAHVKEFRLAAKTKDALRLAQTPHLWGAEFTVCTNKIMVIPAVSGKNYLVLPIAIVNPLEYTHSYSYAVCNSSVYYVHDATLYNFGILQSSMFRAWVYGLCGTNGESTRFNAQLYRTFVWPKQSSTLGVKNAAEAILEHRKSTKSTLHGLYCGEMSEKLIELHKNLDEAVEELYGTVKFVDDNQRLGFLIDLYNREMARKVGSKKRQSSIDDLFQKKRTLSNDEK